MLTLNDLPDEVIVNIFSYLPLVDRKNTRLVCQRWHSLNYSLSLIKDDITSANNYLLLDKTISPNVRHVNVRTKIVQDTKFSPFKPILFWKKCGENLKSIEIFLIDVYSKVLVDIFRHCPNLEYLSLSYWDENDTMRPPCSVKEPLSIPYTAVNLPKLLSLDLMHMCNLTAEAFHLLTENALALKRISLEWWRPYEPNPAVLCVLHNVVKRQSSLLKEINLSHSHVDDGFVKLLVGEIGPQLTGLYLQWCEDLTDDCLPVIGKRLSNLKELDLARCKFTGFGLSKLFSSLKNLTHVCLKKTQMLTDDAIMPLRYLTHLTGLDLSECPKITDTGLVNVFGYEAKLKMMDLRLTKLTKVTDACLKILSSKLPNLRFFYLNGCRKLTNDTLEAIFEHNVLLRCLSIQDCSQMTSLSVGASVNALKGLIHLDLYGCHNMSSLSVRDLRLIELQTADLSDVALTMEDICSVLVGCPSLQYLYLDEHLPKIEKSVSRKSNMPVFRCGYSRFEPDSLFD